MALSHPEAQVKAITTVAGNASLERMTANAFTILHVLERDVPVYAGCGKARVAKDTPDASNVFGQDGLGDSRYPPSKRKVAVEHALHALVRLAKASVHDRFEPTTYRTALHRTSTTEPITDYPEGSLLSVDFLCQAFRRGPLIGFRDDIRN